jgi:hypothetical protein
MEPEIPSPYSQVPAPLLILSQLHPVPTTPPQTSRRYILILSSHVPDYFVSRGSISTWVILNICFLRRGVVSTLPNLQAGGPPLVGCPRLLIQFIHSYPPYWRPFLHPQPEDAPCRGDRDPHSWSCIKQLTQNPLKY